MRPTAYLSTARPSGHLICKLSCTRIHCRFHLATYLWCHSIGTLLYVVQHSCPDLLLSIFIMAKVITGRSYSSLLVTSLFKFVLGKLVLQCSPLAKLKMWQEDMHGLGAFGVSPDISTAKENILKACSADILYALCTCTKCTCIYAGDNTATSLVPRPISNFYVAR